MNLSHSPESDWGQHSAERVATKIKHSFEWGEGFNITIELSRRGFERYECVGIEVKMIGRPKEDDGWPVVLTAARMRRIPFGQYVDRARRAQFDGAV